VIVAIDPGIRGCGVALFWPGSHVHAARYVRNPERQGNGPAEIRAMALAVESFVEDAGRSPEAVVVEWPQVYQGSKQTGDPNDLLTLAAVDGAILALFAHVPEVRRYLPREWKGQVPANVCARRILERLTPAECARVDRLPLFVEALDLADRARREIGGTDHNTIDAVGIGLKFVGRFEPHRVIMR
jgi:hypothetical protein